MSGQTPDLIAWGTITGVLLPYLLALVNQPSWSGTARRIVAVLASIAVGTGTAYVNGAFDHLAVNRTAILAAIATVFIACQGVYAGFAKPVAKSIEQATALPTEANALAAYERDNPPGAGAE